MSSIGPTAAAQATAAPQQHHHHGGHRKQVLDGVAKTLGMSTDDVRGALQSGTSLSQLATQKGVSQDDLLSSIQQGLGNLPNASQVAERIASRVPGGDEGQAAIAPGPPPADGSSSVSFLA